MGTHPQITINEEVVIIGIGLHLGHEGSVRLCPAPVNTGLVFVFDDQEVLVSLDAIESRPLRTALSKNGKSVETVEHLLSAISGLGITNLKIIVKGSEPPACDGSAKIFCDEILKVGLQEQDADRFRYCISEPVVIRVPNGGEITALPYSGGLKVTYVLHGEGLPDQILEYEHSRENYLAKISGARTFCREFEVEALTKTPGIGDGANESNTLVVRMNSISQTQRFENELAAHKILDLIGDLSLFGRDIEGHLICHRSGHACNHELLRALRRQSGIFSLNINTIKSILPHAYPFLLVDRILDYEENKRVVGLKNVTINEPFFVGHFPDEPIMPGVLLIEALAQTGAACLHRNKSDQPNKLILFTGVDKVKFRHRVVPGDQVILDVRVKTLKAQMGVVRAMATVGQALACEAELKFMIVEREVK